MKFVKIISLLLITGLCLINIARADEASKRALVIELMEVAKISNLMDQMAQTIYTKITSGLIKKDPTLPPRVYEILDEEMSSGFKSLNPTILAGYEELYSKYFTEDELEKLIAFQKSPVGQKSIELLPKLFQEGMVIGQNAAAQAMPTIMENFKKRLISEGFK